MPTIREIYTEAPKMDSSGARRLFPTPVVRDYFFAIMRAYDVAGIAPSDRSTYDPQSPGLEDEEGDRFQVSLARNTAPYTQARFVAEKADGSSTVAGVVGAHHQSFGRSKAGVFTPDAEPTLFELTRGSTGSLALVTKFVMEKSEAGLFVPVSTRPPFTDGASVPIL